MNKIGIERIVLGIDPGTNVLGYCVLEQKGKELNLIKMDIIRLGTVKEMSTKKNEDTL